jgi:secreted trypsin-like serine protease
MTQRCSDPAAGHGDLPPFYVHAGHAVSRGGWVTLVVVLLLAPRSAGAIVNGAPASDARYAADFGWAVALVNPGSGGICTAQLISATWVLTAGHCTSSGLDVRLGNSDRTRAAVVPIAEAVRHPRYDAKTGEYDVGLIRLRSPVSVAPIRIATREEAAALLKPGSLAVIAGWGKRSTTLPFSERLVVSDVELRSLSLQKTRVVYFDPVSGPCGGDSGGPLLLARPDGTRVLAGIASRVAGDLCAQGGGIGVYVNIAEVRDFIEAHVKDLPKR